MNYTDIINKVSDNTGIPSDIVDSAYKSFWLYIKESIQKLPLKGNLNDKEFSELRTNFNIPSLGKLTCTYDRYCGIKKRFENIKAIREKNEEADLDKTP